MIDLMNCDTNYLHDQTALIKASLLSGSKMCQIGEPL